MLNTTNTNTIDTINKIKTYGEANTDEVFAAIEKIGFDVFTTPKGFEFLTSVLGPGAARSDNTAFIIGFFFGLNVASFEQNDSI